MRHIPKSAQRHIDALQRIRQANAARVTLATADAVDKLGPPPRRMALDETPNNVARAHDVYLDGVKQRLCIVADMDKGYVKRYVAGVGNIPLKSGDMETLFGDVQIVRKGTKLGPQ